MADAVRASIEECRAVYEKGYRTWSNLYRDAIEENASFPKSCFDLENLFQHHPHFPRNLELKCESKRFKRLSVAGHSIWEISQEKCDLPPIREKFKLTVSRASLSTIAFPAASNEDDGNLEYEGWFGSSENHLFILIRAWSYILSARWAEIMPGATFKYTKNRAKLVGDDPTEDGSIIVDVGDVDSDAATWWSAILAPGEGWTTSITLDGEGGYLSPWSTTSRATSNFLLSTSIPSATIQSRGSESSIGKEASSDAALAYLSAYCTLHNVMDQSYAALSTALLFPHIGTSLIHLPKPVLNGRVAKGEQNRPSLDLHLDDSWTRIPSNLEKLLVLSCNVWGMRCILSSLFYEPDVACNTVSSWLQSVYAILDPIKDTRVLAHIFMNRIPHLGFLWFGGVILNLHKGMLQESRRGITPTERYTAMWTGTLQSFLQEPVSETVTEEFLSRADEIRLYQMTQERGKFYWPPAQWKPFGNARLESTCINVRLHAKCKEHGLRYAGSAWNCRDGKTVEQACDPAVAPRRVPHKEATRDISVDYGAFDYADDGASRHLTGNIMMFARWDGYPLEEKEIYTHEWFEPFESDDDEELPEEESKPPFEREKIEAWIDKLVL